MSDFFNCFFEIVLMKSSEFSVAFLHYKIVDTGNGDAVIWVRAC